MGATAPFWRFSAASYPDLKEQAPAIVLRGSKKGATVPQVETTAGVCASLLLRLLHCLLFVLVEPSLNFSLKFLTSLSTMGVA